MIVATHPIDVAPAPNDAYWTAYNAALDAAKASAKANGLPWTCVESTEDAKGHVTAWNVVKP